MTITIPKSEQNANQGNPPSTPSQAPPSAINTPVAPPPPPPAPIAPPPPPPGAPPPPPVAPPPSGAGNNNQARTALLGSITSFQKGGLKKTVTVDKSKPKV